MKAWEGRFKEKMDEFFENFSESVSFDHILALYDIKLNKVYSEALNKLGIISDDELQEIYKALKGIEKEIKTGKFRFSKSLEDVHINIEHALYKKIGETAYKIHTGRSRNDQVVTDLKLYLIEKAKFLKKEIKFFISALLEKAEEYFDVVIPGFTHLQHAQPVLFSHWILAYGEMMLYHLERTKDLEKRLKRCPLGSAAFAGSGFPLDRDFLAKKLGFKEPTLNSVYSVSSRDFLLEFLFIISLIMLDLSRLCEELILWMTQEFGYIELPEKFCSGSSIMPQKKNPDSAELIRGKTASVISTLFQLFTLIKNLPLSYNRDLQEDKAFSFKAIDTAFNSLKLAAFLIKGLRLKPENIEKHLEDEFLLATEIADYLVFKGVPFRKAHFITGQIVSKAEREGKKLSELSLEEFKTFSPLFEKDIYEWLTIEHAIKRRKVKGGTAPERVKEEIALLKQKLKKL